MKKERKKGNGKKHSISHNTSVNDMGELVAGMGTVGLGEDRREKSHFCNGFAIKVAKVERDGLCSCGTD